MIFQPITHRHLRPVLVLYLLFQILLFAPRLNSDGAYYYEYLRSWVVQNDLNFDDEREFYTWEWVPVFRDFLPGDWEETGYPPNIFSFGPAIVWLPFYLSVHLLLTFIHGVGFPVSMSGYGILHRFVPMLVSMLSGWFTLVLCDRLGKAAGFESRARSDALLLLLGASHLPAFLFVTPAFSHAFSVMFTTWFVWLWYHFGRPSRESGGPARYMLYGMIGGMAVITRWQNLFCMILPLVDAAVDLTTGRSVKQFQKRFMKWTCFAAGLFVIVLPQLLVTKALYGRWLTDPQGDGGMHWLQLNLRLILFDRIKGLFTVNPVLLPALVALPFLWRRNRRMTWGLVLLAISQTYINAVRRDWAGVGFGMRRFLNLTPVFALGLMILIAAAYRSKRPSTRQVIRCIGCILIIWNVLLMAQYYLSPLGAPWINMTFRQMFMRQFTLSPGLLGELVATSLAGRVFNGDLPSLFLLAVALACSIGVAAGFRYFTDKHRRFPALPAGRILAVWLTAWILMLGWLTVTISGSQRFETVNLVSGPSFGHLRSLTLNPSSGYRGCAAGMQYGPGSRWTVLSSRAEYDKNRFLDAGTMHVGPTMPAISGSRITWHFPVPVPARALYLISGFDVRGSLAADDPVAEVSIRNTAGQTTRLPVIYGRHTGCSPEQRPVNGTLLHRDWPALRPIQDGWDTRAEYIFSSPQMIRSLSIDAKTPPPVIWRVRGVAFHRTEAVPVIGEISSE